jgi:hypothetical protein
MFDDDRDITETTTYQKEDGRWVIRGRVQCEERAEGFFGDLWENETEQR